jgi:hypothetical protein
MGTIQFRRRERGQLPLIIPSGKWKLVNLILSETLALLGVSFKVEATAKG